MAGAVQIAWRFIERACRVVERGRHDYRWAASLDLKLETAQRPGCYLLGQAVPFGEGPGEE